MRVDVRVMGQRRAPGVEDAGHPDAGARCLGSAAMRKSVWNGGLERDAIDLCLVPVGDVGDLRRQGEDDMIVLHRQRLGLARGGPGLGRGPLALGAHYCRWGRLRQEL